MNLLSRLTIKNLKLNQKRTIVTIIGIILSVALVTAVSSMYASAIASLIKFEVTEKGNFHLAVHDVPISQLSFFQNNRHIEKIYLTKNIGYAKLEDSQNEYKPYAYVKAFTKGALENLSVRLLEGRLPENENEIVIPLHLETNGRVKLNVGDTITLNVGRRISKEGHELNQYSSYHPDDATEVVVDAKTNEVIETIYAEASNESIVDTKEITYKIVGVIRRPANNIEGYSAPGYTFITYINDNDLGDKVDVYAKYTKQAVKDAETITNGIISTRDYDIVESNTYLIKLQTKPFEEVAGLGTVVIIVCVVIVLTSVFCIKNSFDISITEKTKQYGMLASIGATKKQIRKNVFFEATILGLIGIPIGILCGFLASYILIAVSNYFVSDMLTIDLIFRFSWGAVFLAVILGAVTIYLSAVRSAWKASKIMPIVAIRNGGDIKIKARKIKGSKVISKLFGVGGNISYKNLKRNKKKYRTTVISIVVSVAVFIAMYSFSRDVYTAIKATYSTTEYNLLLNVHIGDNEELYQKAIETTKLNNIKEVTLLREVGFVVEDVKYTKEYREFLHIDDEDEKAYVNVFALGEEAYRNYLKKLNLSYDDMKDKIIISDSNKVMIPNEQNGNDEYVPMRKLDYQMGDKISGILESEEEITMEVGYLTTEVPFGFSIYGESIKGCVSDEFFQKINPQSNSCIIYYDSSKPNQLQNDIEEVFKGYDREIYMNNIAENVKMMENLYTLIAIFLYGFIIVISLIGVTNIFNTITTSMELRKPEFAMLKSIGMTKKEFHRMIRLESIFVGVKALVFGIPIGVILSYVIFRLLNAYGFMDYRFPIVAIAIAALAVFLLITCIMKFSMGKINKQNIIETIRNENI